ncbi:hypothetical protein CC85DRAFT_328035 [Cutaneotrichosporon oleaginosum]|uniref:Uncharacterized protein n=1 Tax=Cutaneotrichosporon oleaginosum TaxID=879819 RepID=A0A0J0XNG0_9TREE|nr:uncharacterized protein CC85DRAFT_328035 [Cutaneotrichosporon oleaginosum]KLT42613.1 hypothetical protein CC85DRAFT_328035 [Cutaneotrichosporon oleaginosum]TXT05270.1 hypothetical protein COLE_06590 [Cutaneotrichosporon oleaginosum]
MAPRSPSSTPSKPSLAPARPPSLPAPPPSTSSSERYPGTMLLCSCCGQQTVDPAPSIPAPLSPSECVPSCFPRRQRPRRRPTSPPPPSSHSLVPPTRLGRWRLQFRARVRLQAARLAQVARWRRMAAENIVLNVVPPDTEPEDTPRIDDAPVIPAPRWRLAALPVRFRLPAMPSVTSLLRRRSDASNDPDPDPGALELPPHNDYAGSEITCQTRRTSLDYDAFGPTIADRMKRQPRRNSW